MQNKIHSADIEPDNGSWYVIVNGEQWARFDSVDKAVECRNALLETEE